MVDFRLREVLSLPGEDKDPEKRSEMLFWLNLIERNFDAPLLKGRNRFSEAQGWVGIWLIRSLIGTSYKKVPEDSVNTVFSFFSNQWQTWITYLGLIGVWGISGTLNLQVPAWQPAIAYGVIAISLLMSMVANLMRMLNLNDPYFNSNAYKLFKRQEYNMFLPYFKEHKLTFKDAQEWVKLMYKENNLDAVVAEHKDMNRRYRGVIEDLKVSVQSSDDNLKEMEERINELDQQIKLLQRLAKVNEDGFNNAISTIYRLRTEDRLFNTSDLRVVTDFSLFELEGTLLRRLCELGTTETPREIDIYDSDYEHYSSIKLVQGENTIEYATSDREGRTVASYWIELPSKRILIYNFHYESTNMNMNDIIETKEMYRYIKGICMHLDERGLINKEGRRHVATN